MANQNQNPVPAANSVATAIQPANAQLAAMAKQITALTESVSAAGGVAALVKGTMATAANSIRQLVGAVQGTLGDFVGAFRPDMMVRFQKITNDLMATIGEMLVPIMSVANEAFRWLADTFAGMTSTVLPLVRSAIEQLRPVAEVVGQALRSMINFDVIKAQFAQFAAIIQALSEPITTLLPVIVQIVQVIQAINIAIVSGVTSIISSLAPVVSALATIVGALVQVIIMPFELLSQVIGPLIQVALLPLRVGIALLSAPFRALAAVFDVIQQLLKPLRQVVLDVFKTLGDGVSAIQETFGEIFGQIKGLFQPIVDYFSSAVKWVAGGLQWLANKLRQWINDVRQFFGLSLLGEDPNKAGNSAGKGAVQAQFTNTDEIYKKLAISTFGAGRGTDNYQQTTAQNTGNIHAWLKDELPRLLIQAAKEFSTALTNGTALKAANATRDPAGALGGFLIDMWRGQQLSRT